MLKSSLKLCKNSQISLELKTNPRRKRKKFLITNQRIKKCLKHQMIFDFSHRRFRLRRSRILNMLLKKK